MEPRVQHAANGTVPGRELTIPATRMDISSGLGYKQQAGVGSQPVGLLGYWHLIRPRKGTILLALLSGAMLGLLVTLPQTSVYRARASLEVQDINQEFLNIKQNTPEAQSYSALADLQTQIKILQSETLTDRTVKRLQASPGEWKPGQSRLSEWGRTFHLSSPAALDTGAALNATAKSLKIRAAGPTRIIEILADATDPKMAADFANTLTNEFIDQNMEARWRMSQRTGDWLARQLDDMRMKLEHSEGALQSYARDTGLVFMGTGDKDRENISDEKLRQIQVELSKAQTERVVKQSRYEMAKNSSPEALPDVLNDTNLREYQAKLTDLKRQMAELSSLYTAENSKVKRLQAQIHSLEAALDRERAAITNRIKNEYDEAVRRETLLAGNYANQLHVVTNQSEKSIQYNILKREVDSNRQLYDSMLQRVKESGIASALKASNVRIVDAAKVPSKPYSPKIPVNVALGAFAGAFLGIGLVLTQARADRTIQSIGDSQLWLGLPELGAIPSAKFEGRRRFHYGRSKTSSSGGRSGELVFAGRGNQPALAERLELVTLQRKASLMAEAFRVIVTSILFSDGHGGPPRVLVLTSSAPSEGKTTVACNLAIAISQTGHKVLLIDADLRRPRIHEVFDLPNDRGLSTLLRETTTVREPWLGDNIHETEVPGLFVLPSGPETSAASNLLYSPRLGELLKHLRAGFDMIIIDTPPMLQMSDARVAARLSDAIVLVLRSGKTTRDAALAICEWLRRDNTRLLGTILNDWNPQNSPNGYYGRDGYCKSYRNYQTPNRTSARV